MNPRQFLLLLSVICVGIFSAACGASSSSANKAATPKEACDYLSSRGFDKPTAWDKGRSPGEFMCTSAKSVSSDSSKNLYYEVRGTEDGKITTYQLQARSEADGAMRAEFLSTMNDLTNKVTGKSTPEKIVTAIRSAKTDEVDEGGIKYQYFENGSNGIGYKINLSK
ncbi:MAG TPA: DUF6030 family protein [Pyrinomonadaceae bacterium]